MLTRFLITSVLLIPLLAQGDSTAQQWLEHFRYQPPPVSDEGVCAGTIGALPSFSVTPPSAGRHLVRVSLPFGPGALPDGMGIEARIGEERVRGDLRALTFHPGQPRCVRRGMVTFPFAFSSAAAREVTLHLVSAEATASPLLSVTDNAWRASLDAYSVRVDANSVQLDGPEGRVWSASVIAPARTSTEPPVIETIESGEHYLWLRVLAPDATWPRIVEVRLDVLGTASIQAHVQRQERGNGTAPELGWVIEGPAVAEPMQASFSEGSAPTVSASGWTISFPEAALDRRGGVEAHTEGGAGIVRFVRCRAEESVPMQEAAWRRATVAIGRAGFTPRSPILLPEVHVAVDAKAYAALYPVPEVPSLALWPDLGDLQAYHHDAIVRSMAVGDDAGNVTTFAHGAEHGGYYGMNRLNHCPPIFREAWRCGDDRLRDVAVLWCSNMHDLSVWWGAEAFGGTRYNAAIAAGDKEHEGDANFMWRTNWASHFCTKGFDSFLYAYEETGDPRMLAALRAQTGYAKTTIHTNTGEARNIGDVIDCMNLYACTGVPEFLDEAMRLFRELREKLSAGDLFSQSGAPIVEDGPFIDDDGHGYEAPFAKPYIIGYGLAGLPDLLRACPDEPKLRDTVRAVADFLAESMDPVGGWRYPHPASSSTIVSQGLEHAAQVARAARALEARGEDISNLLDCIEQVLQARVMTYVRTGRILAALGGWERATGAVDAETSIYDLYARPSDRDRSRDYTEGTVSLGDAPPEGLVYLPEVLAFYLAHRPAERLFQANPELRAVLARTDDGRLRLVPQEKGAFLRIERPENSAVGFTLWAPEWVSYPTLGYGEEELGGMPIAWIRDEASGAVSYTIDRPDATFSATFVPHLESVECFYTTWPKDPTAASGAFAVGPCQQMKNGIFEGDDADLMGRMYFLSGDTWTTLASCANGNSRNVQYLEGRPSPEMMGAMAEGGWKTIQSPRPTDGLLACVSTDGAWVAGIAAEHADSICNNANASHRCMHSHGNVPLRRDGPTTLRVMAYLMPGTLGAVRARYARDTRRWDDTEASAGAGLARTAEYGMRALLPSIHDARIPRLDFPLAWANAQGSMPFDTWRQEAREVFMNAMLGRPPLAPFNVQVLATEAREGYSARKVALNLSADTRVSAYVLIPDGGGPFPAVVALHDHGAHFSIGKEKVIRPFGVSEERMADAQQWVDACYGGRWFGDELAKRGYVVFSTDALFWGDRGRAGGVKYEDQQVLAANMFQLGLSWAGTIIWDDIRSAEFVQGLPEVDPDRIACMGLSMGSNRAWHLTAVSDIVKAGAAICWMGDTATLMAEGNNQTTGQSAFSMLHPDVRNALDFPDVASMACPKPMLFYNGAEDGLFPVAGVEACFAKMRAVWDSQGAGERLETRIWPVPHVFNVEMQDTAFAWLDAQLGE